MPIAGDILLRDREEIRDQILNEMQNFVPDIYLGLDGNFRLLAEVMAGLGEAVFLALQIYSEDSFVITANITALQRHGDQYGVFQKQGTPSTGLLLFSGLGGTFIPAGTQSAYEPFGQGKYFFVTLEDGTIPNPGIPTAPTTALGAAGNVTGLMEYGVTFVTPSGETEMGATSTPLSASSNQISLTSIPAGGPGTTARRLYRQADGGGYQFVIEITDNTTTIYTDDALDGDLGDPPPNSSTAEQIQIAAQSENSGARYNVTPGSITVIVDSPSGVLDVFNTDYFTGGTDPEPIEIFRQRILSALRNPNTGSPADLKRWAEDNNEVETATVYPNDNLGVPANGHTTVRLSGPGGIIPSNLVVDAVQVDLNNRDIANMVIHVASFDPVPTNIDVQIDIASEFALDEVSPSVSEAIAEYVRSLEVGETLYVAGIVDAVFGLSGIDDVQVLNPTSNLTTASSEKRVVSQITVSGTVTTLIQP